MARRVAYPFLTLDEATVLAGPWMISLDGGPTREVGLWVPDWDYSSRIRLWRKLGLDWKKAAEQLQVAESQLSVSVLVTAGTGSGSAPRSQLNLAPKPLTATRPEVLVEYEPDSAQLSQRLRLATSIALTKAPIRRGDLSPATVGARIWSDTVDTRLEGDEPRFPMEVVSFGAMFGNGAAAARAPWFLQWQPGDPNRDFHGAVRLFLNEDVPEVVDRITAGDARLIQAMLGDVISQVVERTVASDDGYEDLRSCDPGSIGAAVVAWVDRAWPGEALSVIRASLEYHPGRMRAALLAVADVGEMEDE